MKTPNIEIERMLLGEVPADHDGFRGQVRAVEPETAMALEALRASNEEILKRYPVADMRAAVERKMAEHGEKKGSGGNVHPFPSHFTAARFIGIAAALCCIAAAGFALFQIRGGGLSRPGVAVAIAPISGDIRLKGDGPRIFAYEKNGDSILALENDAKVSAGNVLQLSYISGGYAVGAIVSVDGNGTVTQHFPDFGDMTAKLKKGGEVVLGFSYKLDDAPRFERFFFVAGKRRQSITKFKRELSQLAREHADGDFDVNGIVPAGLRVSDFKLLKEQRDR
jgi:hypothetical protein